MAIKQLYSRVKTAVHFYFRHFYSFNKRLLQLVFRKNGAVILQVQNHTIGDSIKRGGSTILLTISTRNSFILSINGLLIPVLNDKLPISIQWPLEKGNNKLTVCAIGIGSKKRCAFTVENDQPSIQPIPFNKQFFVKEPNRIIPAMIIRLKQPTIRNTSIPSIKLELPTTKRTTFSLNQSLEEDLLNFLANNQKEHE
jgi:hypothetical protein